MNQSLPIRRNSGDMLLGRDFTLAESAEWQRAIEGIYARMKARSLGGAYSLSCNGIELTVLPYVYAPRFFTDSLWFAEQLPKIVGTGSLLEVGTGTGLIAIACALAGARVVATDINPDAVRNAKLNVARHGIDIRTRLGSLYEPLDQHEEFDFIFWAHPFNNWNVPVADMLMRSGRDYHYEGVRGYVTRAKEHLAPGGKLLLGTGDSADLRTLNSIASDNRYRLNLLAESDLPLEEGGDLLVKYLLFEFVPI